MTPITISKEEFKKEIINFFEKSMPIAEAKKKIVAAMKKNEYDNFIKVSNVRLLYSNNAQYAEGGIGWYLQSGKNVVKL